MDANPDPLLTTQVDLLTVRVYRDRQAMGAAAAAAVAAEMREVLARQPGLRVVFAAAPSQNEFLAALAAAAGLDWPRVTAFQMDEYLGLPPGAPGTFGRFLADRLFDRVRPGVVHRIDPANDAAAECARYAGLLAAAPLDIVCLGVGENGHLAFNDPPDADFADPACVKAVALSLASRRQQVHDGCFPTLGAVPTGALTLTVPALLAGRMLSCVVPGPTKRTALRRALRGPVTPDCPASALRRHPRCTLWADAAAYGPGDA